MNNTITVPSHRHDNDPEPLFNVGTFVIDTSIHRYLPPLNLDELRHLSDLLLSAISEIEKGVNL